MVFNFHTHCHYCDGKGNPEDFAIEAVNQKFTAFGFSSHAPLPIKNDFAIKEENMQNYVDEIHQLRNKYAGKLPIFTGLECDYIPGISVSFKQMKEQYQLDYIIGGVHLVKKGDQLWFIDGSDPASYDEGLALFRYNIKKAVGTYFEQLLEMIDKEEFDIVAHLDKIKMHNQNRFFQEDEKWYMDWIEETLRLIKEKQLIVEINTRGLYKKRCDTFYPSPWIIKRLKELSIPVTISTDSHHCSEISLYFNEAMQCLKNYGIQEVTLLTNNGWKTVSINFS
jgi:histidinol-phosphatase (PHP family)